MADKFESKFESKKQMEVAICVTMVSISRRFSKVKCSLGKFDKKKTARVRQWIKEKIQNRGITSIISIAGCEFIVNSWQKKTSPRGAHRKGYDQ